MTTLPECSACAHQVRKLTVELYKRFGIHRSVADYPPSHYDETLALVDALFSHMNEGEADDGYSFRIA